MVIPLIVDPTYKIYSDLVGQFPTKASKGNQCIFVLYNYDYNAMLTGPMKKITGSEIIRAYAKPRD